MLQNGKTLWKITPTKMENTNIKGWNPVLVKQN